MGSSLWRPAGILGASAQRHNLREAKKIRSNAEGGMDMWHESNNTDRYAKSRPPTTVRIEVDLVNRTITAVWELLRVSKQMAFSLKCLSGNDDLDVLSAARTTTKALEEDDQPYRFVDSDTVEVWQILNDGELRLLATLG
jgi:hypothetical protein